MNCPKCQQKLTPSEDSRRRYICECQNFKGQNLVTVSAFIGINIQIILWFLPLQDHKRIKYLYLNEVNSWTIAIVSGFDRGTSEIFAQGEGRLEMHQAWNLLNKYKNLLIFS